MFMALESVLRSIVTDMGLPKDIGGFARFLKDHPDIFHGAGSGVFSVFDRALSSF